MPNFNDDWEAGDPLGVGSIQQLSDYVVDKPKLPFGFPIPTSEDIVSAYRERMKAGEYEPPVKKAEQPAKKTTAKRATQKRVSRKR